MSRTNDCCWHGFNLLEVPAPTLPGYVVGVAPDCRLCEAEAWTTCPYLADQPAEMPPKEVAPCSSP